MKYLIFERRGSNLVGDIVAQINVTGYNKKEINSKWDELEEKYSPEIFKSSLLETDQEKRVFMNSA